jgi:hypothetical protein
MATPGVRYAEPNWVYTKAAAPNDFYYTKGKMVGASVGWLVDGGGVGFKGARQLVASGWRLAAGGWRLAARV